MNTSTHSLSTATHSTITRVHTELCVCVCVSPANHNRKALSGSLMSASLAAPQTRDGQLISIRPRERQRIIQPRPRRVGSLKDVSPALGEKSTFGVDLRRPRQSLASLSDVADSVLTPVPPHLITINFQSHYISCSQMRRFSGGAKNHSGVDPSAPHVFALAHGNRTESCGKRSAAERWTFRQSVVQTLLCFVSLFKIKLQPACFFGQTDALERLLTVQAVQFDLQHRPRNYSLVFLLSGREGNWFPLQ